MYIKDAADGNSPITSLAQIKQDDLFMPYQEVPRLNWTGVPSKSIKACTNLDNDLMTCTYVNCHYYRNFWPEGSSRDASPFKEAGKIYKTFGFFADFRDDAFTTEGLVAPQFGAVKTSWMGYYPAYKAAMDAKAAGALASMAAAVATISILL